MPKQKCFWRAAPGPDEVACDLFHKLGTASARHYFTHG
jgi:hypothetical protein